MLLATQAPITSCRLITMFSANATCLHQFLALFWTILSRLTSGHGHERSRRGCDAGRRWRCQTAGQRPPPASPQSHCQGQGRQKLGVAVDRADSWQAGLGVLRQICHEVASTLDMSCVISTRQILLLASQTQTQSAHWTRRQAALPAVRCHSRQRAQEHARERVMT